MHYVVPLFQRKREPRNQKPYLIGDNKSFEILNMRTRNENPQYKKNKDTHLYRITILEHNFTAKIICMPCGSEVWPYSQ